MISSFLNAIHNRNRKKDVSPPEWSEQKLPTSASRTRRPCMGPLKSPKQTRRRQSCTANMGRSNGALASPFQRRSTATKKKAIRRQSHHGSSAINTGTPDRKVTHRQVPRRRSCTATMGHVRGTSCTDTSSRQKRSGDTISRRQSTTAKTIRESDHERALATRTDKKKAPRRHSLADGVYSQASPSFRRQSYSGGMTNPGNQTRETRATKTHRKHASNHKRKSNSRQSRAAALCGGSSSLHLLSSTDDNVRAIAAKSSQMGSASNSPKKSTNSGIQKASRHGARTKTNGNAKKHSHGEHATSVTNPSTASRVSRLRRQSCYPTLGGTGAVLIKASKPAQHESSSRSSHGPKGWPVSPSKKLRESNGGNMTTASPIRKLCGSSRVKYSSIGLSEAITSVGQRSLKTEATNKRTTDTSVNLSGSSPYQSVHNDDEEGTWDMSPSIHSGSTHPSKLEAESTHSRLSIGGSFYEESHVMATDDEDTDFEYVWDGSSAVPRFASPEVVVHAEAVPSFEPLHHREFTAIPFSEFDYQELYASLQDKSKNRSSLRSHSAHSPSSVETSPTSWTSTASHDSRVQAASLFMGAKGETRYKSSAQDDWMRGDMVKHDASVIIPRFRFAGRRRVSMV